VAKNESDEMAAFSEGKCKAGNIDMATPEAKASAFLRAMGALDF